MPSTYTIGALAEAAGVPTTTVRYYERRGLLRPATRVGSGGYRAYGNAELERLRFIRAAQQTGFSLEDIAALISLRDGKTAPCRDVQDLIEERLREVALRAKDLKRLERELKSALQTCRRSEPRGRCDVMEALDARALRAARPPRR
jgi:MerR family mercuric resistance operon transcriptional regulator